MFESVFADFLAPCESVQAEVENPGIGFALGSLGIDGQAAVIDNAGRRDLMPNGDLGRAGSRLDPRSQPRQRLRVLQKADQRECVTRRRCSRPLRLSAEHAAGRVYLVDGQLNATDHGDPNRSIRADSSGNQSDEDRRLVVRLSSVTCHAEQGCSHGHDNENSKDLIWTPFKPGRPFSRLIRFSERYSSGYLAAAPEVGKQKVTGTESADTRCSIARGEAYRSRRRLSSRRLRRRLAMNFERLLRSTVRRAGERH